MIHQASPSPVIERGLFMKKIFLQMFLCSIITALCVGITSCDSKLVETSAESMENPTEDSIQSPPESESTSGCEIIERNGINYIVFDDITKYLENSQDPQLASVEFNSISEFKTALTTGNLTDAQKQIIATAFPKDEYGILSCDPQNIYEPQMPSGFVIDCVYWEGVSYGFSITTSSEIFGFVRNLTQEQYAYTYQKDFEEFFSKDTITVEETIVTNDGKSITTYTTRSGQLMQVRYTLSVGDRTITVDETYRLYMADNSINTSSSIPSNVTLYCAYAGAYYVVDLYGFNEKPSETWLSEFGMQFYVEQNVVDK